MHLYLFERPDLVSAEQLEAEMLPLLPDWRRKQALQFKHTLGQVLCAKAFLLLQEGLRKDYGYEGPISFGYIANGKPVLRERPDIHFSLSHCKEGVLCVIDDQPVGCDIESVERNVTQSLISYCCNEKEQAEIANVIHPEEAFIKLWTQKESIIKLSGEGITSDLKNLMTPEVLRNTKIITNYNPETGLAYSIASPCSSHSEKSI